MKRYFAAGGLMLASIVYFFTQHTNGEERRQVVPPKGASNGTLSTATPSGANGALFGSAITSSNHTSNPAVSSSAPAPTAKPPSQVQPAQGRYKNGAYTGSVADAYYGYIQVRAVVSNGKLTDVKILQYPNDRSTSRYINSQALPYLIQEAVQAQSARVDTISGASDTSAAFRESLSSALGQA